jgi:hypothetical protein
MEYNFNKQGVADMCESLQTEWGAWWDSLGDGGREHIEITVDGRTIHVPICADNTNAIEFLLREMLIADQTGEATKGNLRVYADENQRIFDLLP